MDAFEASSVTIKLIIQTLLLKQWLVKREVLRRTKNRFDELDIKIPHPHRTIYHRNAMDIVSQLTRRDSSRDEQKSEEKEVEEKEYQN